MLGKNSYQTPAANIHSDNCQAPPRTSWPRLHLPVPPSGEEQLLGRQDGVLQAQGNVSRVGSSRHLPSPQIYPVPLHGGGRGWGGEAGGEKGVQIDPP